MCPYPHLALETPDRSTSPERSRRRGWSYLDIQELGGWGRGATSEIPGPIDGTVGLRPQLTESLQYAGLVQAFAFHRD